MSYRLPEDQRLCLWRQKVPPVRKRMNQNSCPDLFLPCKQTPARLIQRIIRWEQHEQQEEQGAAVLVLCNSLTKERNSSRLVFSLISFVIQVNGRHSIAIRKRS